MRRMWPAMCLLIACLLITCQCAVQVALADGEHKLTTSDRQVIATSAAWPAVITLEDGSVAMMYQLARRNSALGANFRTLVHARMMHCSAEIEGTGDPCDILRTPGVTDTR